MRITKKYFPVTIILIIAGLICIGSVYLMRIYFNNLADKALALAKEREILLNLNDSETSAHADHQTGKIKIKQDNTVQIDTESLGYIKVPDHKIESAIVEGVSSVELCYAVGHFPGTAMPGENGNCCIAGHSSLVKKMVFNNLADAKKGDEIWIYYKQKKYIYSVEKNYIVEPTQLEVIDQNPEKKELTLTTCANYGTKRRIIKGILKSAEKAKVSRKQKK